MLGVVLLWLLVDMGKDMELAWAPVLAMGTALAPLARLLVLFWQPQQGLHELALLPGLPMRPAQRWPCRCCASCWPARCPHWR